MMLHHLDLHKEAQAIEKAVEKSLELKITTSDINSKNPFTTTKVGGFIADYITHPNDSNINYKNVHMGQSTII